MGRSQSISNRFLAAVLATLGSRLNNKIPQFTRARIRRAESCHWTGSPSQHRPSLREAQPQPATPNLLEAIGAASGAPKAAGSNHGLLSLFEGEDCDWRKGPSKFDSRPLCRYNFKLHEILRKVVQTSTIGVLCREHQHMRTTIQVLVSIWASACMLCIHACVYMCVCVCVYMRAWVWVCMCV